MGVQFKIILPIIILILSIAIASAQDNDNDGIPDAEDPYPLDYDNDGLPTYWEQANGLRSDLNDAQKDPDNDGLVNIEEFRRGTDPKRADSDGDGINDNDEILSGTDPLNPRSGSKNILFYIILLLGIALAVFVAKKIKLISLIKDYILRMRQKFHEKAIQKIQQRQQPQQPQSTQQPQQHYAQIRPQQPAVPQPSQQQTVQQRQPLRQPQPLRQQPIQRQQIRPTIRTSIKADIANIKKQKKRKQAFSKFD